jgi:hypothetical protein
VQLLQQSLAENESTQQDHQQQEQQRQGERGIQSFLWIQTDLWR